MTRDQQNTTKVLDASMADYLRSYGWRQDGLHHWRHPKLADDIAYPMHDAYVQTRANKKLGVAVMFLNIYSVGPLIIVRAPDKGVPWVKLMRAAGRILHQHGLRSKDMSSVDSEGLENVQKLEEAFSGAHWFRRFMLYDFDAASGEFKLARGAIDE